MSAPNRVDDLRKRYSENPRRFFAPLANEYRKTGFIDRAILLCEKHLGEQPGNMNGLVVYGQCLFETGRLDAARSPFEAALGVDPENLIALRHLGDIARLGGDNATARQWYERVLEFDRRNDEVQELLAEVGGGEAQAPSPSIAPNIVSVASSVRVTSGTESLGMIDLDAPVRPATPPAPTPPAPTPAVRPISRTPATVDPTAKTVEVSAQQRPPKRASLLDLNFDFGEAVDETPAPAPAPQQAQQAQQALLPSEAAEYGFATIEAGPSAEDVLDSMMIEEPSAPEAMAAPMAAPMAAQDESPMAELGDMLVESLIEQPTVQESLSEMPAVEGLELSEFHADVAPLAELESHEFEGGAAAPLDGLESAEFQVPAPEERDSIQSIAMDNLSLDAIGDSPVVDLPLLSPLGEPETESRRSSPTDGLPLLPSLEEAETLQIDVDELRRRFETPATFVTETMAELYEQQGLKDKAIDVYRQLIGQAPNDQGLKDRLSALEKPPAVIEAPADPAAPAAPAAEFEEFPEFADFADFADETPAAPPKPEPRATAPRITLDFETPTTADFAIEPPAPANSMLSEMSFADVSLTTPADPARREPTPVEPQLPVVEPTPIEPQLPVVEPPPIATGPSAREFFSAFARRALTPLSTAAVIATAAVPSAAGGPLSPLDEVFGTSVDSEDERSAHRLAAIGATSGPSGGTELDSIFGEGPSAPMPPEGPSALGARSSVGRASTKLRFDQFFASSVPSATPSGSPPVQESDAVAQPIAEPASAADPADDAYGEEPPEDDDLDQFQGWLRGLTQ